MKLLSIMNMGLFGAMVAFLQFYVEGQRRVSIAGGIGAAFALAVFVAPLAIIVSSATSSTRFILLIITWINYELAVNNFATTTASSDPDQERRVHALLALLLPDHQRRRLVLLRPPLERFIRRGNYSAYSSSTFFSFRF